MSWSVHMLVDLEDRDCPLAFLKCATGAHTTRFNHKGAHTACNHQGARHAHARPKQLWGACAPRAGKHGREAHGGPLGRRMEGWKCRAARTQKRGEACGGRPECRGDWAAKPQNDPHTDQHSKWGEGFKGRSRFASWNFQYNGFGYVVWRRAFSVCFWESEWVQRRWCVVAGGCGGGGGGCSQVGESEMTEPLSTKAATAPVAATHVPPLAGHIQSPLLFACTSNGSPHNTDYQHQGTIFAMIFFFAARFPANPSPQDGPVDVSLRRESSTCEQRNSCPTLTL